MSRPPISSTALSITSRLRRPRKSIFSRPSASTSLHRELRHDLLVGALLLQRHDVDQRLGADHDAGGVDRVGARQPSSGRASSTISFATGSESTALRSSAPGLRHSSSVCPGPSGISFAILSTTPYGISSTRPGVADGGARGHRREGDDLRDAVAAVLLGHVVDDALAAGDGEVDVHVGHRLAARVEEPLEEQVVADRVEVGDLEAVGDEAAGGRAAARADADRRSASRSG